MQKEPPEPPSKFVHDNVTLALQASVFFVDMDGLHDGQAIKTIIGDLQPRKMVSYSLREIWSRAQLCPDSGQVVSRSLARLHQILEHHQSDEGYICPGKRRGGQDWRTGCKLFYHARRFYLVRVVFQVVTGELVLSCVFGQQLTFPQYEDYEVAVVDGRIIFSAGSTVPTLEASFVPIPPVVKDVKVEDVTEAPATENEDEEMPQVKAEPMEVEQEVLPEPVKAAPQPLSSMSVPSSIFVGDLRLAVLKNRLGSLPAPIPAEFAGEGVLICGPGVLQGEDAKAGSIVAVRKLSEGNIVLEGGVGKTYDEVRRELYKGFAQVVAS